MNIPIYLIVITKYAGKNAMNKRKSNKDIWDLVHCEKFLCQKINFSHILFTFCFIFWLFIHSYSRTCRWCFSFRLFLVIIIRPIFSHWFKNKIIKKNINCNVFKKFGFNFCFFSKSYDVNDWHTQVKQTQQLRTG